MSSKSKIPDYELAEKMIITAPAQLRAIADPLRDTILDLLLERAATVAELAAAVERPKSTVAHDSWLGKVMTQTPPRSRPASRKRSAAQAAWR